MWMPEWKKAGRPIRQAAGPLLADASVRAFRFAPEPIPARGRRQTSASSSATSEIGHPDTGPNPSTPSIRGRLSRAFPGPGECCRKSEACSLLVPTRAHPGRVLVHTFRASGFTEAEKRTRQYPVDNDCRVLALPNASHLSPAPTAVPVKPAVPKDKIPASQAIPAGGFESMLRMVVVLAPWFHSSQPGKANNYERQGNDFPDQVNRKTTGQVAQPPRPNGSHYRIMINEITILFASFPPCRNATAGANASVVSGWRKACEENRLREKRIFPLANGPGRR